MAVPLIPVGIKIRPIGDGDRHELERFYAALSADSLEARFHGARRGIGDREARSFCGPDHLQREGLVAVEQRRLGPDRVVGHVCLEPIDDSTDLEIAIAVADAWQHHGIGRALLGAALDWATRNGVKRLHAAIRWSNPAIIGLLRSVDLPMHIANGADGDLEAVISLGQPLPAAA